MAKTRLNLDADTSGHHEIAASTSPMLSEGTACIGPPAGSRDVYATTGPAMCHGGISAYPAGVNTYTAGADTYPVGGASTDHNGTYACPYIAACDDSVSGPYPLTPSQPV